MSIEKIKSALESVREVEGFLESNVSYSRIGFDAPSEPATQFDNELREAAATLFFAARDIELAIGIEKEGV